MALIVSGWRNYDVLSLAAAAVAGTASTACVGIRFSYPYWNKGNFNANHTYDDKSYYLHLDPERMVTV